MSCSGPLASVSNNSKSETELFPLVTSQGTTRFLDAKQVPLMTLPGQKANFMKTVLWLRGHIFLNMSLSKLSLDVSSVVLRRGLPNVL